MCQGGEIPAPCPSARRFYDMYRHDPHRLPFQRPYVRLLRRCIENSAVLKTTQMIVELPKDDGLTDTLAYGPSETYQLFLKCIKMFLCYNTLIFLFIFI